MKCSSVESLIVEYAEGALGPADEMCIDIHLIQCEECRADLGGLRDLLGAVAGEVGASEVCEDCVEFLDRFRALEADSPPLPAVSASRRARLPVLRLTAAMIVIALALSPGLMGRPRPAWFPIFGSPVAEARSREIARTDWSPYLRNGLDLADLDKMGLVGPLKSEPAPRGD